MKKLTGLFLIVSVILVAAPAYVEDISDITHNNIIIILDGSGSMRFEMKGTSTVKMDAAKTALKEILKQVPQDTNIGLLVFSDSVKSDGWVYPLGPRDDEKLLKSIDLPQPKGGTPLGEFIKRGANKLMEVRDEQFGYGTYRLLVVTDGEATDKELMNEVVPKVISRGIVIDAIGVDMTSDHTLATQVHSYRKANDPASLKKAIADVFAEIADLGTSIATEDAFAEIAPIPIEMAQSMLKALTTLNNQEITDTQNSVKKSKTQSNKQNVQSPVKVQPPQNMPRPSRNRPVGVRTVFLFSFSIVFFFIILIVVIAAAIIRKR